MTLVTKHDFEAAPDPGRRTRLEITILPDGRVSILVSGTAGSRCRDLTETLVTELGVVRQSSWSPEAIAEGAYGSAPFAIAPVSTSPEKPLKKRRSPSKARKPKRSRRKPTNR